MKEKNKYIVMFTRFLKEKNWYNSYKFEKFYKLINEAEVAMPHIYLQAYDPSLGIEDKNHTYVNFIKNELITDIINEMKNILDMKKPNEFGFNTYYDFFNESISNNNLYSCICKILVSNHINDIAKYIVKLFKIINIKKI